MHESSKTQMLNVRVDNNIAYLTMDRPEKRNAMCDQLLGEIESFFTSPSEGVRVVILAGSGGHFCSGLDLSEHVSRDPEATMRHSRNWHRVMDIVQYSGLPVISVLKGAVIGGGLELATSTHIRVAEPSAFFQLPEGRRGIFVGGGASVKVGRILGADRMTEMMLTGRRYSAEEGMKLGLTHYLVDDGKALEQAETLAKSVAQNAELANYMMIQAISKIEDMSRSDGLFTESLCAAISQTSKDSQEGLRAFLEKRQPKFQ